MCHLAVCHLAKNTSFFGPETNSQHLLTNANERHGSTFILHSILRGCVGQLHSAYAVNITYIRHDNASFWLDIEHSLRGSQGKCTIADDRWPPACSVQWLVTCAEIRGAAAEYLRDNQCMRERRCHCAGAGRLAWHTSQSAANPSTPNAQTKLSNSKKITAASPSLF